MQESRSLVVSSLVLALIAAMLAATGCSTQDEREAARHAKLLAADQSDLAEGLFHAEIQLRYRSAGSRWSEPADRIFAIRDESSIQARVTLHNLRPRRTYSVHLAWIRPDGREMFRRYAEVVRHEIGLPLGAAPDSAGVLPAAVSAPWQRRFGAEAAAELADLLAAAPDQTVPVNEITYKRPVDLHFAQFRARVGEGPAVTIDSRLDISRERQRQAGRYHLRIYLDRRLLAEVPFEVHD